MSKKIIVAVSGIAILAAFVLSIDAYAIPFTGNTFVAKHIGTDDYYVVIAPGNTNIRARSVNLRRFRITRTRPNILDFTELTKEKNLLVYVIRNYEEQWRNIVRFVDRDGNRYRIRVALSSFHNPSHAPVPEPSTILLIGTGLVGLIVYGRKKIIKT